MKPMTKAVVLAASIAATPAFSTSDTSTDCAAKLPHLKEAWTASKSENDEADEVTLSTATGDVEVTAEDAQPTENWFGKPPGDKAVDDYLAAAEKALEAGDEEACMEQLTNVEDAMSAAANQPASNQN